MAKKQWWQSLWKSAPAELGLALSGGGVRGLAHIGVLKVLEQEAVPIRYVSGTSAGGLIGSLYAAGLSPAVLEREALQLTDRRHLLSLLDRTVPRRGLLAGHKLMAYLGQWLGSRSFDQLSLPLAMVAVDISTGEQVILQEGSVLEAVRATIALPGLFPPAELDGRQLVDGGLLNNLPVDVVRQMGADVVIGVNVSTDDLAVTTVINGLRDRRLIPEALISVIEVLWHSLEILTYEVNRRTLEESPPDLLLSPAIPPEVSLFTGLTRVADTIAAGERAAREAMPQIRKLLGMR